MGRKGKATASKTDELEQQVRALKLKQEAALKAVQQAANELDQKQSEVSVAQEDLSKAEKERNEADSTIKSSIKMMKGDDALISRLVEGLEKDGYAYADGFIGEPIASYVRDEVRILHRDGKLHQSELAGGKSGENVKYKMSKVRGDVVAFVRGDEEGCWNMNLYKEYVDQVVLQVQEKVAQLQGVTVQRGNMMVTCYPGGGEENEDCGKGGPCRYIYHCDNPDENGRVLTTLLYLNPDWEEGHGGHLRIHPQDADGSNKRDFVDVAPLHDRFLIFYSDRRNPHEVRPSSALRYAVTTWYYDKEERDQAVEEGSPGNAETDIEAKRILEEITKFENQTGAAPQEVSGDAKGLATVRDTDIEGVIDVGAVEGTRSNIILSGGSGGAEPGGRREEAGVLPVFDLEELD